MASRTRQAAAWVKLALNAILVIAAGLTIAPAIGQPHHDFLAYWTAGRLNVTGGNPYAIEQVLVVQQAAGWPYGKTPFIFPGPPWLLPVMMPFGALPYAPAAGIWIAFNCLATVLVAGRLWRFYGGSARLWWAPILISLAFVPAFGALVEGQVTPLMFLGAVAFLYFVKREAWFWAGAAAVALSFKPQLAYLFWPALLLWVVDRRRWLVLAGSAAVLAASLALAVAANPPVISQFAAAIGGVFTGYADSLGPGTIMRLLFGADKPLLRLLPMAPGVAWLIVYWARNRQNWEWREHLPLLILVSVATTASSWLHDEVLFLLPVIQGAAYLTAAARPAARRGLAVLAGLDLLAASYFVPALYLSQVWFSWLPFAFLAWYVWAQRAPRAPGLAKDAAVSGAGHALAT